jgi:hypothetical protein
MLPSWQEVRLSIIMGLARARLANAMMETITEIVFIAGK